MLSMVRTRRVVVSSMLALSIAISPLSALAGPGDINSTNDGHIVQGGNYYNTPDSKTTFVNSGSGGLWVKSDTLVRGLEVNPGGDLTGHGGTLHFSAPGSVVRLDGNIDVSGIFKGGQLGNGGRVLIDSAFLYQNGNIFANGANGGSVQFNTGTAVFGPDAGVYAKGLGQYGPYGEAGNGGTISVNASGMVDLQYGAVFDTSGKVIGTYDTNVINIQGGLINIDGVLIANGAKSRGGTVRLVATGDAVNLCVECTLDSVGNHAEIAGLQQQYDDLYGQLEGASSESSTSLFEQLNEVELALQEAFAKQTIDDGLKADLLDRAKDLVGDHDGDIRIGETGQVLANGSSGRAADNVVESNRAGDGGTILMAAVDDIVNKGDIEANGGDGRDGFYWWGSYKAPVDGGNGGTIVATAGDDILNFGHIEANGGKGGQGASIRHTDSEDGEAYADSSELSSALGGNGGLIAFSYDDNMRNTGRITAQGGQGGQGANAFAKVDIEDLEGDSSSAYAEAYSGEGSDGGDGGLIVFSGENNPDGGGLVSVDGGQGGQGGDATAIAKALSSEGESDALAFSEAGHGGEGGEAGLVVAPDPESFPDDQVYTGKEGLAGAAGKAIANAEADAKEDASAESYAYSGDFGITTSKAKATSKKEEAYAYAETETGDGGKATANAQADAKEEAFAYSYVIDSGDFGTSTSKAKATSKNDDAIALAEAGTGDSGKATANAEADAKEYAYAESDAVSGDFGTSTSNAKATSKNEAEAEADARTGDSGKAVANAQADAKEDAYADAYADSGDFGISTSKAKAISKNEDAEAYAGAETGDSGKAVANAQADAKEDAYADAYADSGDFGISTSKAKAFSKDEDAEAYAGAETGDSGKATANAEANSKDEDAYADSYAYSGDFGTSTSKAKAFSKDEDAEADAEAETGYGGKAVANAEADAKEDAYAYAYADYDEAGFAKARAEADGDYTEVEAEAGSDDSYGSGSGHLVATAKDRDEAEGGPEEADGPKDPYGPDDADEREDNEIDQLRSNELLSHNENLILLSQDSGYSELSDRFEEAFARTVTHQKNHNEAAKEIVEHDAYANFVVAGNDSGTLELDQPHQIDYQDSTLEFDNLHDLNSLIVSNDGDVENPTTWRAGRSDAGDDYYANGGGLIALLADGDIFNEGNFRTYGYGSGGSIALAADGNIVNLGALKTYAYGTQYGISGEEIGGDTSAAHGGSIILKADENILNLGGLDLLEFLFEGRGGGIKANADDMGGTIQLFAGDNILNLGDIEANATNPGYAGSDTFSFRSPTFNPWVKLAQTKKAIKWAGTWNIDGEWVSRNTEFTHWEGGSPTGGIIISQAGNINANLGNIEANSGEYEFGEDGSIAFGVISDFPSEEYPSQGGGDFEVLSGYRGLGGYIHQHGDNVSANIDLDLLFGLEEPLFGGGNISALGSDQGGRILLTAGQLCETCGDSGEAPDEGIPSELFDWFGMSTTVPGLSQTGLTPPVTTLRPFVELTKSESALNFGHIDTRGGSEGGDGQIYLAGNGQFGVGNGASFNGVELDLPSILGSPSPSAALQAAMAEIQANGGTIYFLAGDGSVQAVACEAAPNGLEPLVNGVRQGSLFPDDFTLPDPLVGEDGLDPNLLGLFQHNRYITDDTLPGALNLIFLALSDPNLYLASQYAPVTEEILALALAVYNQQLAQGKTPDEARRQVISLLTEAGINPEIAASLLEQIEQGLIVADNQVVDFLTQIAGTPSGTDELVQ